MRSARHVALIADGNGRWARRRGLSVQAGHRAGAENLKARLRDAAEWGVEELTIFAFSTENWNRPVAEVSGLLELLGEYIDHVAPELHREGVQLRFLGRRADPVPPSAVAKMERAERLTADNDRIRFFIPFNYGGRAELLDAARAFDDGGEEEFRRCLYAPDMRDPDLLIRTGGERRLSNFLLWQLVETELVFRDELWPEFSREAFAATMAEFRGTPTAG